VFAWKSAYDIREVVIPTLKELIEEQEANMKTAMANGKTKTVADVTERWTMLTRALSGWESALERVDELYETAETSSVIKPVTNLVPESFIADKSGKDSARYIDGSEAPNSNELREISAFSFVGGGSSITYVEDLTLEWAESTNIGVAVDFSTSFNFAADVKAVVVGFTAAISTGLTVSVESNTAWGTAGSVTNARSFTLSDPDVGDSFDVKVCVPQSRVLLSQCAGVPRPRVWHAVLPHQEWTQQVRGSYRIDRSHKHF
jgi:hypothetical protein